MRMKLLAVAFAAVGLAQAGTVFSNLDAGFGPDGLGIGAIPIPGVFKYHGVPFTPAGDFRLTTIEIPLSGGPSPAAAFVMSDLGGLPGAVLESFDLAAPAGPPVLVTATSGGGITVSAGTQYWVVATGGAPDAFVSWALTLFTGDPLGGGATRIIRDGVDEGWILGPGTRMGAVRVSGEPLAGIPEPGTWMLLALGLGVLRCIPRRGL